jgi:tetratricopeptide (TPR) repeat protein
MVERIPRLHGSLFHDGWLRYRRVSAIGLAGLLLLGPTVESLSAQAVKSAVRPVEKQAAKPANKPVDTPVAKPIGTTETKPAETKPTESKPAAAGSTTAGPTLLRQAYEQTKVATTEDQFTAILDLCEEALEGPLDDKNKTYGRELLSWTYYKRGKLRGGEDRNVEALADFDEAIGLGYKTWPVYHQRGVSYGMLGKYDEAAEDFDQVIKLNPSFDKAWYNRGELKSQRGEWASAIEDYTEALLLAPDNVDALVSRGQAYARKANYDSALVDLNRAVTVNPNSPEAYVHRAAVWADLGQYANAADDYRASVRLGPDLGIAFQGAAWLMATCPDPRFRDPQLALQAAKKAIELNGDGDFRYLDTLAAAYASAGEFETAIATQKKAIAAATEPDAAGELKQRLKLYEQQTPYRESQQPATAKRPTPRKN